MHLCNRFDDPNIRKLCLLSRLRLGNDELRRFVLLAYIILSLGLPAGENYLIKVATSSSLFQRTSANYIRQVRLNALMSQVTVPLSRNLPVQVVQCLRIGQQHGPRLFRMMIF